MRTKNIAIAILALAATVSACGSHAGPHSSTSEYSVTSDPFGGFNDVDVMFAQGMIPHHQQAVEMADMALAGSAYASTEVKDLAQRIKNAQAPEIATMKGWLTEWNMPLEMSGMGGMSHMTGVMSDEEMASLMNLTYAEFDKMWLELMIKHHQGALDMANSVKSSGTNSAALMLADQIIGGQTSEIAEMQMLLK